MDEASIYHFVKQKLITHGVENTACGRLTLNDQNLFSLFVRLERETRYCSFDAVRSVAMEIEDYLLSREKHQLMAFVYMYLKFSDLTPKRTLWTEHLEDGCVRTCVEYQRQISDEEALIGLWASVKFDQVGKDLLRVVYSES